MNDFVQPAQGTNLVNYGGDVIRTIPARKGDWMQTFTGRQFWPLDPRPDEIDVLDIAHSLGHQCRYAGHTRRFYSIAEHCILMSLWIQERALALADQAPTELEAAAIRVAGHVEARWALFHDASEAYVVDVPRPLKRYLRDYAAIETGVQIAIAQRFELPGIVTASLAGDPTPRALVLPPIVHEADNRILLDERAQLLSTPPAPWGIEDLEPLGVGIDALTPARATEAYLARLESLGVPL